MPKSVQEAVNKYLEEKRQQEEKEHPYSGLINATHLGQCLRRIFYSVNRVAVSEPMGEWELLTMQTGDLFHSLIQTAFQSIYPGIKVEQVYKDSIVSVRADMLDDEEVYEIKSVHSGKFDHFKKELQTKTILEINPEHVMQLVLGMIKFERSKGRLIYVSRDNGFMMEFYITLTDELLKMVSDEVNLIRETLQRGQLPAPQPRLYGDKIDKKKNCPKECAYCDWYTRCLTER